MGGGRDTAGEKQRGKSQLRWFGGSREWHVAIGIGSPESPLTRGLTDFSVGFMDQRHPQEHSLGQEKGGLSFSPLEETNRLGGLNVHGSKGHLSKGPGPILLLISLSFPGTHRLRLTRSFWVHMKRIFAEQMCRR